MTKNQYNHLLEEVGIYGKTKISREEAEGQDNIIKDKSIPNRYGTSKVQYYKIDKDDELTDEQIKIALMTKELLYIKSIRSMFMFFTILTVIGLIGWVFIILASIIS